MDSIEILMEFFRNFFGILAGGKLGFIPCVITVFLGAILSAVVIAASILTAKATNRGPKLAITAGVFTTLTILTAPLYNNLFKGFMNGYMNYLEVFIDFINTPNASPEIMMDEMSYFISSALSAMPLISVLSTIVLVTMILSLVFMGKCFKSKYKVFPIVAFILIFVRYMFVSPIAISFVVNSYLINSILSIAQILFYCFAVALPYLLLIPFAILNRNKKEVK